MINPKIDQSDKIYSNGTKTRQKISESRDEHIFFALDYVLESLQKSRLYVNNKKSSITRKTRFWGKLSNFFWLNLILILTEEKRILLHQKQAQNSEISTFVLINTFRSYCKELNCVETTKECSKSKDKHFYAPSNLSTWFWHSQ